MIFHVYPIYFFFKVEVYIWQCLLVGAFLPDRIVIVGAKMCKKNRDALHFMVCKV